VMEEDSFAANEVPKYGAMSQQFSFLAVSEQSQTCRRHKK
jgi:hypothetical protein